MLRGKDQKLTQTKEEKNHFIKIRKKNVEREQDVDENGIDRFEEREKIFIYNKTDIECLVHLKWPDN